MGKQKGYRIIEDRILQESAVDYGSGCPVVVYFVLFFTFDSV
jgi:hypothetical protein